MVTFQLHKKGVLLIVILALLVAVLLVAAGFLWGRNSAATAAAANRPPVQSTAPTAASATAGASGRRYTLRIAIEATEEDAQETVKALKMKKLAGTVAPIETSEGTVLYEIYAGSYPDRAAAAKAAETLEEEHQLTAAVVPAHD